MKLRRGAIARRYASYIFGTFIFLALTVAGVNCFFIHKVETERMNHQVTHFIENHLHTAVRELWLTDYVEIQRQINTIGEFNYIAFIEITDDVGAQFTAGAFTPQLRLAYDQPVAYEYRGRDVIIGHAKIYTDDTIVSRTVRAEFFRLFLMLSASSVLLSLMASILFNIMMGRHIINLSAFLLKEHEELVETDFILDRRNKPDDELSELADSINKMRQNIRNFDANEKKFKHRLERENRFKDRLFSIISHDLRAPLNSFTSLTDALLEDFESLPREELFSVLREINKSSSSLAMLVENLLEWSGLDHINSEYKPELFSFGPLLSETADLFSRMLADKGIRLNVSSSKELQIYGDYKMIATVLRNLVSNAIKFTPREGEIFIGTEESDGNAKISVRDTGQGMNTEQIRAVLSGGQADSSRGTEGEKGTGLGLMLCTEFIKINKGRLEINSDESIGGTEIIISLPSSVI